MATRYTKAQELKLLFPKLDTGTSLTNTHINDIFVTKAEADIDSAVSKRYSLPFSSTPPLIKSLAQDLTMYYIARRYFTQNKKDKNDWVTEYRTNAFEVLDDLAKGDMLLLDGSKQVISARTDQNQIWSNVTDTTDYNPTMDERDPSSQRIDPRKLDDLDEVDDEADL